MMDDLEAALREQSFTSNRDGELLIFSGRWPNFGARAPEIAEKLNAVLAPYMKACREELLATLHKRLTR
jgi:hypothetical protein